MRFYGVKLYNDDLLDMMRFTAMASVVLPNNPVYTAILDELQNTLSGLHTQLTEKDPWSEEPAVTLLLTEIQRLVLHEAMLNCDSDVTRRVKNLFNTYAENDMMPSYVISPTAKLSFLLEYKNGKSNRAKWKLHSQHDLLCYAESMCDIISIQPKYHTLRIRTVLEISNNE